MYVLVTDKNLDQDREAVLANWFDPTDEANNDEKLFSWYGRFGLVESSIEWNDQYTGTFCDVNGCSFKFAFVHVE